MTAMEPALVDGYPFQHHESQSHDEACYREETAIAFPDTWMVIMHPEQQFGNEIGDEGIDGHQICAALALGDAVEHEDDHDGQQGEQVEG